MLKVYLGLQKQDRNTHRENYQTIDNVKTSTIKTNFHNRIKTRLQVKTQDKTQSRNKIKTSIYIQLKIQKLCQNHLQP